jgi:hypothetical protein
MGSHFAAVPGGGSGGPAWLGYVILAVVVVLGVLWVVLKLRRR